LEERLGFIGGVEELEAGSDGVDCDADDETEKDEDTGTDDDAPGELIHGDGFFSCICWTVGFHSLLGFPFSAILVGFFPSATFFA
jgi:hypothetical protein